MLVDLHIFWRLTGSLCYKEARPRLNGHCSRSHLASLKSRLTIKADGERTIGIFFRNSTIQALRGYHSYLSTRITSTSRARPFTKT